MDSCVSFSKSSTSSIAFLVGLLSPRYLNLRPIKFLENPSTSLEMKHVKANRGITGYGDIPRGLGSSGNSPAATAKKDFPGEG